MTNTCTPWNSSEYNRKLDAQRKAVATKLADLNRKYANKTAELMRRNAPVSDHAPHIKDTIVVISEDAFTYKVRVGSEETPAVTIEQGHIAPDGSHVPGARFIYNAIKVVHRAFRRARTSALRKAARETLK